MFFMYETFTFFRNIIEAVAYYYIWEVDLSDFSVSNSFSFIYILDILKFILDILNIFMNVHFRFDFWFYHTAVCWRLPGFMLI